MSSSYSSSGALRNAGYALVIFTCFAFSLKAQTNPYQKIIGPVAGGCNVFCARSLPDKGLILCGNIYTGSYNRAIASRLDSNGNILWLKHVYAFPASQVNGEVFGAIIPLSDGGFAAVGRTSNLGGASNFFPNILLVKFNANGDTVWGRVAGQANIGEWFESITECPNGDIVIAGESGNRGLMMRYSSAGSLLWSRLFNRNGAPALTLRAVCNDGAGGLIASGGSFSGGIASALVMRLNANGDTLWTRNYFSGNGSCESRQLRATPDGNFFSPVFVGNITNDMAYVKFNLNGDTIFTGMLDNTQEWVNDAAVLGDGRHFLCGITTLGSYNTGFLIEIDPAGQYVSGRIHNGPLTETFQTVDSASGGRLLLGGYWGNLPAYGGYLSRSDAFQQSPCYDTAFAFTVLPSNCPVTWDSLSWTINYPGVTSFPTGFTLQMINSYSVICQPSGETSREHAGVSIRPNPSADRITVSGLKKGVMPITITDFTGRDQTENFEHEWINDDELLLSPDRGKISPGLYLLKTGQNVGTFRLIILPE